MSIKFLVLRGGGYFGFWGAGGSADFIFMGGRIFLNSGRINRGFRVTAGCTKPEIVHICHNRPFTNHPIVLVAHPCGDPNRATQCRA